MPSGEISGPVPQVVEFGIPTKSSRHREGLFLDAPRRMPPRHLGEQVKAVGVQAVLVQPGEPVPADPETVPCEQGRPLQFVAIDHDRILHGQRSQDHRPVASVLELRVTTADSDVRKQVRRPRHGQSARAWCAPRRGGRAGWLHGRGSGAWSFQCEIAPVTRPRQNPRPIILLRALFRFTAPRQVQRPCTPTPIVPGQPPQSAPAVRIRPPTRCSRA